MNRILISSFGPFLNVTTNPTQELGRELSGAFQCGLVELPVQFSEAFQILKNEILKSNPDVIVMLGVASERSKICFETIGLNWIQSRGPDSSGLVPKTDFIHPGSDLAIMTNFNIQSAIEGLSTDSKGHVQQSFSAGTYVCNDLYYRALEDRSLKCQKIFIHVPPFEKMAKQIQISVLSEILFLL